MKLFSGKPQGCGAPSKRAQEQFGPGKKTAAAYANSDLQAEMQQMRALTLFFMGLPELAEDKIDTKWQALQIPEEIKAGSNAIAYEKTSDQIFALFHYLKINQLLAPDLITRLEIHFGTSATLKKSPSPSSASE